MLGKDQSPLEPGALEHLRKLAAEILSKTRLIRDEGLVPGYTRYGSDRRLEEVDRARIETEKKVCALLEQKLPETFRQGDSPEVFVASELIGKFEPFEYDHEVYDQLPAMAKDVIPEQRLRSFENQVIDVARSLPRTYCFQIRITFCGDLEIGPIDLGSGMSLVTRAYSGPVPALDYGAVYLQGHIESYFSTNTTSWRWGLVNLLSPIAGLFLSKGLLDLDQVFIQHIINHQVHPLVWVTEAPVTEFPETPQDLRVIREPDDLARWLRDWTLVLPEEQGAQTHDFENRGRQLSESELLRRELMFCEGIFDTGPAGKHVLNASGWLTKALATPDGVEEVIFLSTAIEALLGDPGEPKPGELGPTHKLGERLAYLLGPTRSARESIKSDFLDFYRLRSRILHGGALSVQADKRNAVLEKVWPLVKTAIVKEATNLRRH